MDRSAQKTTNFGIVDPQVWQRLFRRHHPLKTAEHVAARLGASPRTVANWMAGVSAPSLGWFAEILRVYGPEVLAELLPNGCGWLSIAISAQRRAQLEAEQRRIDRALAALDELSTDQGQ